MKIRSLCVISLGLLAISSSAVWAKESCSPAKKLVEGAKAFYGDKTELRDVIQPQFDVGLKGMNGHPDPSHMLYRWEGEEHLLPIVEGRIEGLESAVSWSDKGELCSIYEDGPLSETEDDAVRLSVSFQFPFRRKASPFSVKEINEGAKDGSKIIRSLAPKGLGFAAPGLKTFAVIADPPEGELPTLTFLKDGKPQDVATSKFYLFQYVRLKDLKSAKIDQVKIEHPYKAFAFFKIDPKEMAAGEAKRLAALEAKEN